MSKITENWVNTAAFGHTEHYNISNVAPTRCLNVTYVSHNHSSTNKFANLPKRQRITGQRTVKLLLVWNNANNAHNPINNPTVQITDLSKQNTLLLGNYTTDRRTVSHLVQCGLHHFSFFLPIAYHKTIAKLTISTFLFQKEHWHIYYWLCERFIIYASLL